MLDGKTRRNPVTHRLDRVRREVPDWKRVNTQEGKRWCRELPFFANGQIRRIVLKDDPDNCEAENPNAPTPRR